MRACISVHTEYICSRSSITPHPIHGVYKIRVLSGYQLILDPAQATEMTAYQYFSYSGACVSAYPSEYMYRVLYPLSYNATAALYLYSV